MNAHCHQKIECSNSQKTTPRFRTAISNRAAECQARSSTGHFAAAAGKETIPNLVARSPLFFCQSWQNFSNCLLFPLLVFSPFSNFLDYTLKNFRKFTDFRQLSGMFPFRQNSVNMSANNNRL